MTTWFLKNGFHLEMQTYEAMKKRIERSTWRVPGIETVVMPAFYYLDHMESKIRDSDVFVMFERKVSGIYFALSFCIECKRTNLSKDNNVKPIQRPWVLLRTPDCPEASRLFPSPRVTSKFGEAAIFPMLNKRLRGLLKQDIHAAYSLRRHAEKPDCDDTYSVSQQVLSACCGRALIADSMNALRPCCEIVIPVLVVEDEVYYCEHHDGLPKFIKTDFGVVTAPLPSKKAMQTSLMYVVNYAGLNTFLEEVFETVESFLEPSKETVEYVLKKKDEPVVTEVDLDDLERLT